MNVSINVSQVSLQTSDIAHTPLIVLIVLSLFSDIHVGLSVDSSTCFYSYYEISVDIITIRAISCVDRPYIRQENYVCFR